MRYAGPIPSPTDLTVAGLGVAPGRCCGALLRNRSTLGEDRFQNAILLAQRTRPDDIGRILVAAGTLTLGGALLSHVNLLSRELGKPSMALLPESQPRMPRPSGDGVLEITVVPGLPDETLLLDEGDVLLLDGDRGLLRIPGGNDRAARRGARRAHDALTQYTTGTDDEGALRHLVATATQLELPALRILIDAALLCGVVPRGERTRRLRAALLESTRSGRVEPILRDAERWVLEQALRRCHGYVARLEQTDDMDELARQRAALLAEVERERATLIDAGGSTQRLDQAIEEVERETVSRGATLRRGLSRRVDAALGLKPEDLEAEVGLLERLARQVRAAGIESESTRDLEQRLAGPSRRRRERVGEVLIADLNDTAAGDRSLVGGKAAGLIRFAGRLPEGCRTPRGFIVTTSAYRLHLVGEAGDKIRRAIESSGAEAALSRLARAAILGAPLPPELVSAVSRAYSRLDTERVAVRSSATIEDDSGSSLAGQFDSYLGVSNLDEALDRIRWTWASLWNPRALRLLTSTGRSPLTASMAVLVQELVDTESAGVMFTRDPAGEDGTLLVNAAWGLGEAISLGEVPGDLFWIDRQLGETLAVRPGRATRRIILDPERRGTLAVDLPAALRSRLCLDDRQISLLAAMARRIEDREGRPMDVEFGFTAGRVLVMFQARRVPATSG